jgi:hypothetical protein
MHIGEGQKAMCNTVVGRNPVSRQIKYKYLKLFVLLKHNKKMAIMQYFVPLKIFN